MMPRTGIKLAVRTMLGAQTSAATLRLENDVLSWKLSIADRPHPPFGEPPCRGLWQVGEGASPTLDARGVM